jgi:hypothetical protein
MRIQSILTIGGFSLVSITTRDRQSEIRTVWFGILLIGIGYSILETVHLLWRNRRDSRLFLKSREFIDPSGSEHGRFFTGIRRLSPLYGGMRSEFLMLITMPLMVWWIFNLETRRPGAIQFNGLAIIGFSCWAGMWLLSMTQIVLSFFRPANKAELVILDQGLLSTNRGPEWFEKLPNEFYPWSCIERVVVEPGSLWRDRTLQIDVDRWPWYRTIRFAKIRDEDWKRMLGMIGERVEVVRKG